MSPGPALQLQGHPGQVLQEKCSWERPSQDTSRLNFSSFLFPKNFLQQMAIGLLEAV